MGQDNFGSDDNLFGVDESEKLAQEFDAFMTDEPLTTTAPQKVAPATEEDKQDAEKNGKAKTDADKAAELARKQKEEQEKEVEDLNNFLEAPEEKVTTKTKESTEGNETTPTDSDGINFTEFSKELFDLGVLTRDEDEDDDSLPTTGEEFLERLNYEKQKGAEELVYELASKHGEDAKRLFDAVYVKGVDPKEYLESLVQVTSFRDMDLTDISNQERVMEAALRKQGLEPEDVRDEIKRLKQNDDLESTAQRYHKAVVKQEEAVLTRKEEAAIQRKEQEKQMAIQYSNTIRTILNEKLKTQDFDGIPLNKATADKTVDFLETKKWKLPDGRLITDFDKFIMDLQNPVNYEAKVKLGTILGPHYDPSKPLQINLGPIAKKAVTKETNSLFSSIKSKESKKGLNASTDKGSRFFDDLN
jgi:hypothetical protein